MYSIMRATSFSVFNCKVFLPSLNKVIYFIFIYLFIYLCSPTKCGQKSWLLYKTNRFNFVVGLYSDNKQRRLHHTTVTIDFVH